MPKHVVIVDDDEVWRTKIASMLNDCDELTVESAVTHDIAAEWVDQWNGVDIAIVDAGDIRRKDDHFPGVGVVRQIRKHRGDAVLIIVITGHFLDDALRWRMREARADFFYHRSDVQEEQTLVDAILHPERARRGVPDVQDPEAAFRVGVVPRTRLNEALDFASENNLVDSSARQSSSRSRKWLHMRARFNEIARLNTINAGGTIPDRDQSNPSYDQITRLYRWATRAKPLD
jgi:CheY-like chemotaxis protein